MSESSANKVGSSNTFDENWRQCREAHYNHWTPRPPVNQVQLAFQSHWQYFLELLQFKTGGKCLEIGCGRGSISSYFADNGFDCTLVDLSLSVLRIASDIFRNAGHQANFITGDAVKLPFRDNEFDVVVNIGLLEHFEDVTPLLDEQIRVLKKGGIALCYIVPEFANNVQYKFNWINSILKSVHRLFGTSAKLHPPKADIYRNTYMPDHYLAIMREKSVSDLDVVGMYPLPMVSHSPEFPFTLLPPMMERILTLVFKGVLALRKILYNKNPWTCDPLFGQAFLLVFRKEADG